MVIQDEKKNSPQKLSKFERDFRMPVVMQGHLKRGQKHTMESIEEEDENLMQAEKQQN